MTIDIVIFLEALASLDLGMSQTQSVTEVLDKCAES